MAYDDEKVKSGRRPVYILELYLDVCPLTFGVLPCGATAGDPDDNCYQTYNTCKAIETFDQQTQVYRFSSEELDSYWHTDGLPCIPTLTTSINTAPTKLEPGKGLGIRATLSARVHDHPWGDVGVDPSRAGRSYTPFDLGTFWGKLLARNQYYEGRTAILRVGYMPDGGLIRESDMVSRAYTLHRISGPDADGNVSIECKDPLKANDSERAQWPPQSNTVLTSDITDTQTVIDIDDPGDELTNWLATYSQDYIRIDDEIMRVISTTSGQLTVERASGLPTSTAMPLIYVPQTNVPEEHSEGATVQQCHFFNEERVDDIIYFINNTASGIDPVFLDTAQWASVIADSGYDNYVFSALLAEPYGSRKLLIELTELNVSIWWDEREQVVKMGTLILQAVGEDFLDDESNILQGSVSVTKDVKNRVSQVWLGYGERNPTFDQSDYGTFRTWRLSVDLVAESPENYNQRRVRRIRSRWLPNTLTAVAAEITDRALVNAKDTKTIISATLDPKDDAKWTGDLLPILTRQVQSVTGAPLQQNYLITEVNEEISDRGVQYRYILEGQGTLKRTGVIAPDTIDDDPNVIYDGDQVTYDGDDVVYGDDPAIPFPDYSAASSALRARYAFIAYDDTSTPSVTPPGFLDGTPPYQIS